MLISGKVRIVGVVINLALISFLFLTFLVEVYSQKFGEECRLKDEEEGACVTFSECPSAIRLARNGVKPVFCEAQGDNAYVCCEVRGRSVNRQREASPRQDSRKIRRGDEDRPRGHLNEEEDNRRNAKRWTTVDSDKIESIFDVQRVYQSDTNYYERKKHSISPDLNEGTSGNEYNKRKYYSNAEDNQYDRKPVVYTEETPKYKPYRRPSGSNGKIVEYGSQEENSSGDVYRKNKKPYGDEKTSPHQYQYEYVTKKPTHYENRGSTKRNDYHNSENYETTRRYDWGEQKTTKRHYYPEDNRETTKKYDWGHQDRTTTTTTTRRYDWYQPSTTTKRNNWYNHEENYETTKKNQWQRPEDHQNNWSIEENTADTYDERTTTRRPYRTTTRRENYTPDYRPTPRPHDHNRPHRPENMRISEIKCLEYAQEVTETIAGLPLTTDPKPVKINVQKCIHAQQLIVGGENTTVGEFPHMAAVGFRDPTQRGIAWNCGGSLISDEFVLTAAHCTSTASGPPVMVRLGEYNLKRNDDGAHPVDYSIKEIIKHPDYKPPSKYNDIALLRLSRRVTFHKNIRPACLYIKDSFTTSKTVATGWGRIDYAEDPSEILLKVVLSIIDNQTCNRLYHNTVRSEILSKGIIDSQMCAGELAGGKDTCQGDSGGPIEITSKSNQCVHHIIGITSFGKHCAQPNAPGVYTRVSSYVPWIESIVWSQRG